MIKKNPVTFDTEIRKSYGMEVRNVNPMIQLTTATFRKQLNFWPNDEKMYYYYYYYIYYLNYYKYLYYIISHP